MYTGELKAGDQVLRFGDVTYVMGVINVSPESKNPHTVATTPGAALDLARRYREWGADLIDVGGESTRPGSQPVSEQEELDRVVPVIQTLRSRTNEMKAQILSELECDIWPMVENGRIKPIIHTVMPLTEVEKAHQILADARNAGKVILQVC